MSLNAEQQKAVLQANESLSAENDYLKQRIWALTETARLIGAQAQKEILVRNALIASILHHMGAETLSVPFRLGEGSSTQVDYQVKNGVAEISLQPVQSAQEKAG